MADNSEESKPEQDAASEETPMSNDQSFAYWITMLPFLAIAGVFVFEFSKTPGEYNKLINAAGAVVVGIFVASVVNVLSQGNAENKANDSSNSNETPKTEGT